MVKEVVEYNKQFIKGNQTMLNASCRNPQKKLAILACMDARLLTFLPNALGISDGDAIMIRNAGSMILSEWDTTIRSLLIAVLEFHIHEIMIIGHSDCGVSSITPETIYKKLNQRGVKMDSIEKYAENHIEFHKWFDGFTSDKRAVLQSVQYLKTHPLLPSDVCIYGYVMHTKTGRLTPAEECD